MLVEGMTKAREFSAREWYESSARPVCQKKARKNSDHPELHPAGFADHALVPRRIPDELNVGLVYAVDRKDLALGVVRDRRAHSAAGCGQRHFDVHLRAAFGPLRELAIINQSEIDDVHRDFRIEALL